MIFKDGFLRQRVLVSVSRIVNTKVQSDFKPEEDGSGMHTLTLSRLLRALHAEAQCVASK